MKRLFQILSAIAVISLTFSGCATTNAQANVTEDENIRVKPKLNSPDITSQEVVVNNLPSWIDNPGHGNSIGIGESHIGKKSLAFQRKAAVHNAQIEMARNIKSDLGELLKNYQAISGEPDSDTFDNFIASYSEAVLKETLKNTQVEKSFRDDNGNLYVLLVPSSYVQKKYDLDNTDKSSLSSSSRDNIDAKWQKFQMEEMQKEYDAKVSSNKVNPS